MMEMSFSGVCDFRIFNDSIVCATDPAGVPVEIFLRHMREALEVYRQKIPHGQSCDIGVSYPGPEPSHPMLEIPGCKS